ncbi:MAG: hypothetical protein WC264_02415 [Candidatus Paceibacterota bacterium]|jgi:hypothetical protein
MSTKIDDAPVVWGSDESPVKGKLYSFKKIIEVKSSPIRKTWKSKDNEKRKFLTGRFMGENDGKLSFIGHKFVGNKKDSRGKVFEKRNKRKYSFEIPKDSKLLK